MSFLKLDKDFFTSSIWFMGDPDELKVWLYLLYKADYGNGIVRDTLPAIAFSCQITIERAKEILATMAGPDPHSRSKQYEGRRISIQDDPEWQITVLNFEKYQAKDHGSAARQKRYRERKKTEDKESK